MAALVNAIEEAAEGNRTFLLSEVKVRSPRDGDLLRDRDPASLAEEMVAAGADGLSVVTESTHFGGSHDLLRTVSAAVDVPVLAKDFVGSRADVQSMASHGADAVLLIVADLEPERLATLRGDCLDAGLDPLIETHTAAEVDVANDLEASLVGINNRDIQELELDDGGVRRTERLAPLVGDGTLVVSESSLEGATDVRRAVAAGADAVLVGTAILRSDDPGEKIRSLRA